MLSAVLRTMRPHQWVKNVFVLAALVFARGEDGRAASWFSDADLGDLRRSLMALLAFCLGSSAMYALNDVVDVERDRAHPEKRLRPIAAGQLSIPAAYLLVALCAAASLALGWAAAPPVAYVVAGYMLLNLAYSLKLKQLVLVDVFCIAAGFVLRVEAGALAVDVRVSQWLLMCTLFLSLFLALCKRRAETDLLGEGRGDHRAILDEYDRGFLDQMTTVLASCAILCYALYSISDQTRERLGPNLVWTVPFVVFGVGRYMFLVQTRRGGGSPTRILLGGDPAFLLNTLAWVAMVALIVFGIW